MKYHWTPLVAIAMTMSAGSVVLGLVSPTQSVERKVPILDRLHEINAQILSEDPLVYVIPDLLSSTECKAYMEYVEKLESSSASDRVMTRSNAPEISLETSKLWPLPFLSVLAGLPSLARLDLSSATLHELRASVLPPIAVALVLSASLAAAAVPLLRLLLFPEGSRRTSDAMALNRGEDASLVRPLVDRATGITGHAWDRWEAPVVTRYARGAIFARHGDASPTRGSEWQGEGGQRIVTCICYLNTLDDGNKNDGGGGGGETHFDRLGIRVKPQQGQALFFHPACAETHAADDRTTHESLPPAESEKWIVQMFGRVGPRVPPPLGLPDSYGAGGGGICNP